MKPEALQEVLREYIDNGGSPEIADQANKELDVIIDALKPFGLAYIQNGLLADKHVTLGDWERAAAVLKKEER